MDAIVSLIKQDKLRLAALNAVMQLNLPDCYLAAGFVRNLVWDHLHQKQTPTPLNDVDVIYYDANEIDPNRYLQLEQKLSSVLPQINWQVRNQALMHVRNGDRPYKSSLDAMGFWPEKETAVAIRQSTADTYQCIAAFGFDSLFKLKITHNPNRDRQVFEQRIRSKEWLKHWPQLRIEY